MVFRLLVLLCIVSTTMCLTSGSVLEDCVRPPQTKGLPGKLSAETAEEGLDGR
jgi:hypothetical protein